MNKFNFIAILAWLFFAVSGAAALRCYSGFASWDTDVSNSSVTLKECPEGAGCCLLVASLPGKLFKCAASCPESNDDYPQCGKELDSSWCYCRNHKDVNCAPSTTGETQLEENIIDEDEARDKDVIKINDHNMAKGPRNKGLQCYVGNELWFNLGNNATLTPAKLQSCSKEHFCCRAVSNFMKIDIFVCTSGIRLLNASRNSTLKLLTLFYIVYNLL